MDEFVFDLEEFDQHTAQQHRAIAEFIGLELQRLQYHIDDLKKLHDELIARADGLDRFEDGEE